MLAAVAFNHNFKRLILFSYGEEVVGRPKDRRDDIWTECISMSEVEKMSLRKMPFQFM